MYLSGKLAVILFSVTAHICITTHVAAGDNKLSWCDPTLCQNNKHHIACNNNGEFQEHCEADAVLIDLKSHRGIILHEHNKRRNFIASGALPGYYGATRMATTVWDEELEYLATLNLKTCYLDHDDCHNSYRFRNVGQNLAGVARVRNIPLNVTDIIHQSLGLWFGEYPLIDSSYITKFRVASHLDKYGHFAETVIDRNTHVGCAIIRYTHPDYPFLYVYNIGCNYASVYAIGVPVYNSGNPASDCKTGPNPYYPALCSIKEKYNPNYNDY